MTTIKIIKEGFILLSNRYARILTVLPDIEGDCIIEQYSMRNQEAAYRYGYLLGTLDALKRPYKLISQEEARLYLYGTKMVTTDLLLSETGVKILNINEFTKTMQLNIADCLILEKYNYDRNREV